MIIFMYITIIKVIARDYGVAERIGCLAKSNAFISLKDHKPNFS